MMTRVQGIPPPAHVARNIPPNDRQRLQQKHQGRCMGYRGKSSAPAHHRGWVAIAAIHGLAALKVRREAARSSPTHYACEWRTAAGGVCLQNADFWILETPIVFRFLLKTQTVFHRLLLFKNVIKAQTKDLPKNGKLKTQNVALSENANLQNIRILS